MSTPKGVKMRKGVAYFSDVRRAIVWREILRANGWPDARVVSYALGSAVQYRRSGPYYPELEFENLRITVGARQEFRGIYHFEPANYDASTELAKYAVQQGIATPAPRDERERNAWSEWGFSLSQTNEGTNA